MESRYSTLVPRYVTSCGVFGYLIRYRIWSARRAPSSSLKTSSAVLPEDPLYCCRSRILQRPPVRVSPVFREAASECRQRSRWRRRKRPACGTGKKGRYRFLHGTYQCRAVSSGREKNPPFYRHTSEPGRNLHIVRGWTVRS